MRYFKRLLFFCADAVLVTIALYGALLIRFDLQIPSKQMHAFLLILPFALVLKLAIFEFFGFHNQLWRYASLKEGIRLVKGISASSLTLLAALYFLRRTEIPRSVTVIDWFLTLGLVGGAYFFLRLRKELFQSFYSKDVTQKKVVIAGAGETGSSLARQMQNHPEKGYKPIFFLDDDPMKKGQMIQGVKVFGDIGALPSLMAELHIDEVITAMPSATYHERAHIALKCKELGIACKTVPDMVELVDGKVTLSQIKEIDPKELLGRKEVEFDLKDVISCYEGKVILITGAAGSIGSELVRQAVTLKPARVIATDISENGLYHLEEEMTSRLNGDRAIFVPRIMDVRDKYAVDRIFERFKPDAVFHAAAYKHVPIMERHVLEAMENNFGGTKTLVEAARRHDAERFLFISTDKAVNPTSIMGLSKQFGEKSVKVAAGEPGRTKFMVVRFGNVLNSNGSVIPKFKRQITDGEPITITHRDITRFFMTIHEAVHLVIQASVIGDGGNVFVLNMGEPVKILDLARDMIRRHGLEPEKDIPIIFTGLRPGEKLYEELFGEQEAATTTSHMKIYEVVDDFDRPAIVAFLEEIEGMVREGNVSALTDYIEERQLVRA